MTGTAQISPPPQLTIRTLDVEVIEGPDRGARAICRSEVITVGTAPGNHLVLTDRAVSGYHLELVCGEQGIEVRDLGSTNGTLSGRLDLVRARVPAGTVLRIGRTKLRLLDGHAATVDLHQESGLGNLIGSAAIMRRLMAQIKKAARSPVPTLLFGESGTGKEVVARTYHELSERHQNPFVVVDCGSIHPNLLASELFGHERGAFTGALNRHLGAFERANGGTLFLDEIGELPLDLQPQLLGVLERRRFRRLGGKDEISVDLQILCATNCDLREEINQARFRLDLYYRIAVLVLRLPTLRERREDIPLLIEHFLQECGYTDEVSDVLTDEARQLLERHQWPGNVRELRNWVEVTVAMGETGELALEDHSSESPSGSEQWLTLPYKEARSNVLGDFEKRYLTRVLEQANGNVSRAARDAKMDRTYLIKLLQRHGIK